MHRIAASLVFSAAACCLSLAPARALPISSDLAAGIAPVQGVAYHARARHHHATRHHRAKRHRRAHRRYVMRRHYTHGHWVWVRRPIVTYDYYYDDEPTYYTTYRRHYPRFGYYGGGSYRTHRWDNGTRGSYQTYSSGAAPSAGASVQMRNERTAAPRRMAPHPGMQIAPMRSAQPTSLPRANPQTQIRGRGAAGLGADLTGSVPRPQGAPARPGGMAPGNSGNAPGHTRAFPGNAGAAPGHMEKGH